ncbi:uncharacterized protein N0V89_011380 [Didymosphaeria variabile]|uniref:Uncharacterized protein n=1 Tax=Didymosphaeria variabile TaxID=1932322 RepID=A0A9W8XB14_9PLEO|nr:uncharacterized protein N0V89_011380 [Didymosphaeria variabile]KAJ4345250.1 hypothetical protein N0V89_011380 [Didymosphaeria variabile]
MDIHKWLSETVLPQQPPSPPEQREYHHAPCSEQPERIPKDKRRRKQSTSDSSLLDVPPQRKKRPTSGRVPSLKKEADETDHTDASHSPSRSASSISSEPFRRKPRRKTRPERYEPVLKDAKERGLHTQRRDKGESKRARRKSRRMKANNPGSGMVQGFQAKNVPQDRLTVRSTPVSRSLPDLVFSEMKFLQKHKDKTGVGPLSGSPKKQRKKDQAHAKEEEISAYFTSVRPALAEQELNIQTKKPSPKKLREADSGRRGPPPIVDEAVPTVEPADQTPYSGLEGGGPRHESRSYISWSESTFGGWQSWAISGFVSAPDK